jgi:hypothetical protein
MALLESSSLEMTEVYDEYVWRFQDHMGASTQEVGEAAEQLWDENRTKAESIHREIPSDITAIGIVALDGSTQTIPVETISALHVNPQWEQNRTFSMPLLWMRIGETVEDAEQKLGSWRNFSLLTNSIFVTKIKQ